MLRGDLSGIRTQSRFGYSVSYHLLTCVFIVEANTIFRTPYIHLGAAIAQSV